MSFGTNLTGNTICSVSIFFFFFFSDSQQPCGKRYVHLIYNVILSACVKRFMNVLNKMPKIQSRNFCSTYIFLQCFPSVITHHHDVYASCVVRIRNAVTFGCIGKYPSLVAVYEQQHEKAMISFKKKYKLIN